MIIDPHKALEGRVTVLERHHAVEEVHRINIVTQLSGIEGTLKWLSRLIFGALVVAFIGYVIGGNLIN